MNVTSISADNYWNNFSIESNDLEFIYNKLLEEETPLSSRELLDAVTANRIKTSTQKAENSKSNRQKLYKPSDPYSIGDKIIFPALDWESGSVKSIREGSNPEISTPFKVMEVTFDDRTLSFASELESHALNESDGTFSEQLESSIAQTIEKYRPQLLTKLETSLRNSPDLLCVAAQWFPKSLLVKVNPGFLNLAEAVLDEHAGGPLSTAEIITSIELPTDSNQHLTEFSLNYALQMDGRFDEVGSSGTTSWFLRRLEPSAVLNQPEMLKYLPVDFEIDSIDEQLCTFSKTIADEMEPLELPSATAETTTIALLFPHWVSGTLPLAQGIEKLFPTAYESPRVLFTFQDKNTQKTFNGWVVRENHYVYGLKEWYDEFQVQPGTLITIEKGPERGVILLSLDQKRPTKEYIKTTFVGVDCGLVFADLKQQVATNLEPRMAIAVPDAEAMKKCWQRPSPSRNVIEKTLQQVMRSLAKLNPQGNVHAEEIYACVNTTRRMPPGLMLSILNSASWTKHLGDLYFHLSDSNFSEVEG